jgi:hypothetical protein
MLYSISQALFNEDNEVPERLRTISAKMEQLTTSSSMWSKEHTFSFENFVNLASDVVLQWG